jgi:hypothetical protein
MYARIFTLLRWIAAAKKSKSIVEYPEMGGGILKTRP